jgi:hypothetical protein
MDDIEPPIAFATTVGPPAAVEIRVNFGIVAGREATPAEIDELARQLLTAVEDVSIVAEQHYEVGRGHEATVHLVKIEVADAAIADGNLDELRGRLIEVAGRWAEACAQARHADL